MKKLLLILFVLCWQQMNAQQITRAEYFFDTDPGTGNGTSLPVTPGDSINASFMIDIPADLGGGIHLLCVRVADENGIWSLPEYYLYSQNAGAGAIKAAEYFFDSDPGRGNGIPLPITPGDSINATLLIDIPTDLSGGNHLLCVRVADENGIWSLPEYYLYNTNAGFEPIVAAEYFFDTDPGFGNGIPLTVEPGGSISVIEQITVPELSQGWHTLAVRTMNAAGVWSLPEIDSIKICDHYGPVTRFEYFVSGREVLFTNITDSADSHLWTFGDNNSTTETNPTHIYSGPGLYNVQLKSTNTCGVDSVVLPVVIKGIQSAFPNKAGARGPMVLNISGTGLSEDTEVFIARDNLLLPLTDLGLSGDEKIIARAFNDDIPTGTYHIIGLSDGVYDTLFNALEIEQTEDIDLSIQVDAQEFTLPNRDTKVKIRVRNNSNQPAVGVPVTVMFPSGQNVTLINSVLDNITKDDDYGVKGLFERNLFYKFIDSSRGLPYDTSLMAHLLVPFIAANSDIYLEFVIINSDLGDAEIKAIVDYPYYQPEDIYDFTNLGAKPMACNISIPESIKLLKDLMIAKAGLNACNDDISILSEIPCDLVDAINEAQNNSAGGRVTRVVNIAHRLIVGGLECAGTGVDASGLGNGLFGIMGHGVGSVFKFGGLDLPPDEPQLIFHGGGPSVKALQMFFRKPYRVIRSFDPNAIYGPAGVTDDRYIADSAGFYYTVTFENKETATAPANDVLIVDTLDTHIYNTKSFQFRSFGFDTLDIPVNRPDTVFVQDVDLRPTKNIIVRVQGRMETETGIATVLYQSFDPMTMAPTENVLDGFLPPNVNAPEGEGFVSFYVEAHKSLTTGDSVATHASIIFDNNEPILTDYWINRIDETKPVSRVLEHYTRLNDTAYVIYLQGSDGHSGLRDYGVYMAEENGSYELIDVADTDSLIVSVQPGKTYKFYSTAQDNIYNIEEAPGAPELTMTTSLPIEYTYFNAKALVDGVLLEWEAEETQNKGYDIEHSIDGITFNTISHQPAKTGSGLKNYQYLHATPVNGSNYYRLRQVNMDDTYSYSVIRKVDFGSGKTLSLYPNPAGDFVRLSGTKTGDQIVLIQPDGRVVQRFTAAGTETKIDLRQLKPGVFYVQIISNNDQRKILKLVVQ